MGCKPSRRSLGGCVPPESADLPGGADQRARSPGLARPVGMGAPRAGAGGPAPMTALRIGFLFRRPYGAGHVSIFPKTMQALADAGVVVDVIAANGRLIDLSTVRVRSEERRVGKECRDRVW